MQKSKIILCGGFAIAMIALPPALFGQNKTYSSASPNTNSSNKAVDSADKKFVREAAQGNLAEIELGQLAEQKASSPEVKKFAERMVQDHTKANDQLKEIARNKGISLPDSPAVKDKLTKDRLSKTNGEKFDREYMSDMVKDHEKDVSAFKHESQSGSDTDVKSFASKTLPKLQDHLREAQQLAPATGSKTSSR